MFWCHCELELDKNHTNVANGRASRKRCHRAVCIISFISNICEQIGKKLSELKVKYSNRLSLLFKYFVLLLTLLCQMSFCYFIIELHASISLSEPGVQAIDPSARLFPSLSSLIADLLLLLIIRSP